MNIPKLDASFKAPNGHIYFFYDQVYWRFDEREFKVSILAFRKAFILQVF